jgi:hypothetical protein
MYDGLYACSGVEVSIGCEFLSGGDVLGIPVEEKGERCINYFGEYWRI